jgi:lipopolysaccharide export system protein LptC
MSAAYAHSAAEDVWEPRRALSLKAARRRSRLVGGLRRFFVAGAGAALASVFVFMALNAVQGGFSRDQYSASEPLRMLNPRFTGRNERGGAFQLSAEAATRDKAGTNPDMDLTSPVYRDAEGTIVLAPHGRYDERGKKVTLNGEVLFSDPGGNRFSTPNMIVDLEAGRITGNGGVTGAGPLGVLQADAYEIRQAERVVTLHGNVKGQIPEHGAPAPASGE